MRMLVLVAHPSESSGGDPSASGMLLRALMELGHEVHAVVSADDPLRSHDGLTVHPTRPGREAPVPAFVARAWGVAVEHRPDVVIAFGDAVSLAMAISVRVDAECVPVLEDQPDPHWSRSLFSVLDRQAVRRAGVCLAVGGAQADVARTMDAQSVIELPGVSGLDPSAIRHTGWLRKRLGIESGTMAVAWGDLTTENGTDVLIEGVKVAADADADIHAVIAGGDEQSIDRYEAKAQRLGIAPRVHLVGHWPVSRLGSLLIEADVLVQPDLHESGTPAGLYSFLHSGRPVVLADIPGRDRMVDRDACEFTEPDRLGFGGALATLADDPERRERIGNAGKKCVDRGHTYSVFASRVREFEHEIAGHRSVEGGEADAGTTRDGVSA